MKIKWNWGSKLVVAMAAFILLVAILVIRMVREDISLVEKDYYPKGQAYQALLDKVQNTIPYAHEILVDTQGDQIHLAFPSFFRPGSVSGSVHFYHRVSDSKDFQVGLALDSSGVFRYPSKGIKGRYILKIDWAQDGISYYTEKNLTLE